MGEPPPSHRTAPPRDEHALDETDPHAGDDADWEDAEPAAAPILEPSPLLFWKGVLYGTLLSGVAWLVLAAMAYALYMLLTR